MKVLCSPVNFSRVLRASFLFCCLKVSAMVGECRSSCGFVVPAQVANMGILLEFVRCNASGMGGPWGPGGRSGPGNFDTWATVPTRVTRKIMKRSGKQCISTHCKPIPRDGMINQRMHRQSDSVALAVPDVAMRQVSRGGVLKKQGICRFAWKHGVQNVCALPCCGWLTSTEFLVLLAYVGSPWFT